MINFVPAGGSKPIRVAIVTEARIENTCHRKEESK